MVISTQSPPGLPNQVEVARVVEVIDGDTLAVAIGGAIEHVRLIGINAPETRDPSTGVECHGYASFERLADLVPVGSQVYLESDSTNRDRYGRLLRYVWTYQDGNLKAQLVNESMVLSGDAEANFYDEDPKYADDLMQAQQRAQDRNRGLWPECGGIRLENTPIPRATSTSVTAPTSPPLKIKCGEFGGFAEAQNYYRDHPEAQSYLDPNQDGRACEVFFAVDAVPAPTQGSAFGVASGPAVQEGSGCDPNYTPCIPAYPPDLNCGDIGFTVQVIGSDPHRLDRDKDGWGCE